MKGNFKRQSRCWKAGGLTLVEVLAGLAILGGLLVAVVMTEARCNHQSALANQRLAACRAADCLLEEWWNNPDKFPRNAQGGVKGEEGLTWKTRVLDNKPAREMEGEVVHVEFFQDKSPSPDAPVVMVDVVLPVQPEEGATSRPTSLHAR
jgi:hypothetical protein